MAVDLGADLDIAAARRRQVRIAADVDLGAVEADNQRHVRLIARAHIGVENRFDRRADIGGATGVTLVSAVGVDGEVGLRVERQGATVRFERGAIEDDARIAERDRPLADHDVASQTDLVRLQFQVAGDGDAAAGVDLGIGGDRQAERGIAGRQRSGGAVVELNMIAEDPLVAAGDRNLKQIAVRSDSGRVLVQQRKRIGDEMDCIGRNIAAEIAFDRHLAVG